MSWTPPPGYYGAWRPPPCSWCLVTLQSHGGRTVFEVFGGCAVCRGRRWRRAGRGMEVHPDDAPGAYSPGRAAPQRELPLFTAS